MMDRMKAICRAIRHEPLPKSKCYAKQDVDDDKVNSRMYASAKITPAEIEGRKFDILSIAIFEPDKKYKGYNHGTYQYDIQLKPSPRVILFFADREFLYKDSSGTMRIDDNYGGWHWDKTRWIYGLDLVQEYMKFDGTGKDIFRRIQQEARYRRDDRIIRMHRKETDVIDAIMDLVPELPKDIDSFIRNVVTQDSRYIYYKKGRDKEAYCTYCRKDVPLNNKKAYHNAPGRCPCCGKKITYKAKGKSTLVRDEYSFAIMQNTPRGLVIRYFKLSISFKDHYRNPETYYFEVRREFINTREEFEWRVYKQRNERWCKADGTWHYWATAAYLYTKNLREVLKGSQYQYSAIYEFARAYGRNFNIERYLQEYRSFPGLEYLVKLKLTNLAAAAAQGMHGGLNKYGKGPLEIMRLPKDKINQAVRLNANADMHRCLVALCDKRISVADRDLIWFQKHCNGSDQLADLLHHMTFARMKRYLTEQLGPSVAERKRRDELIAENNRYMKIAYDYNFAGLFHCFVDYIKMCELVGKDMTSTQVLFPPDIMKAHDDMSAVKEILKSQREDEGIKKVAAQFAALEFKDKTFMIRMPSGAGEIIEEGNALGHCVGRAGYIEKMLKGRTLIMFLRKVESPDKAYYTIEFNPDSKEILQCRGKSNCGKTKDVEKFVNKYMRKVKLMEIALPEEGHGTAV